MGEIDFFFFRRRKKPAPLPAAKLHHLLLMAEAVEKLRNWLTSNFSDFIVQRVGRVIWRLSGDMRLVDEISYFVPRSPRIHSARRNLNAQKAQMF